MNGVTTPNNKRSALLSYFSLFTSLGTLLCCALPSLFILFGLGASVASLLSSFPWLVSLSRHKNWTFSLAGALIGLGFVNMYYIGPRLRARQCSSENPSACADASTMSKALLWISALIYSAGFFVAYVLGPVLTRLDNA
jgi:hypothetical protein